MTDTQFRPEEIAHATRPPTATEEAVMIKMPPEVALGWLKRKRAQEMTEKHGLLNMADGLEALASELRRSQSCEFAWPTKG